MVWRVTNLVVTGGADATTTHRRIVGAAMDCILERGFYRASSNEIARRAGMTWGAIQYYFGTREKLMLAALEAFDVEFEGLLLTADLGDGDTEQRLERLAELLARQYGRPRYLAALQIVLNLAHNPETSQETAAALIHFDERLSGHLTGLIALAIGPHADPAKVTLVFHSFRGLAVSHLIQTETSPRELDRRTSGFPRDAHLLAKALARMIDS
jgi:AcrR family transcriptional regulator